jgi:hypothetical protein
MSQYREKLLRKHSELKNAEGDPIDQRALVENRYFASPNSQSAEKLQKSKMPDASEQRRELRERNREIAEACRKALPNLSKLTKSGGKLGKSYLALEAAIELLERGPKSKADVDRVRKMIVEAEE